MAGKRDLWLSSHLLEDPERLIYATVRTVRGVRIGVAGFNTAWSCCRDKERGRLWMAGKWQQGVLRPKLHGADFSIALLHHPPGWLVEHESEITVDPIVLGEIRFGILLLPAGSRRERLERWFADGVERDSCLPWDPACGLRWAELLASLRTSGRAMSVKDSMIAATALVHGLTVVTGNGRHFEPSGVPLLDPFA